ncbi:MAG: hypothetical protein AAFX93_18650 [Verrucomicrobiota bacterium]
MAGLGKRVNMDISQVDWLVEKEGWSAVKPDDAFGLDEVAESFSRFEEPFPVCFDLAWRWLGYKKKFNAMRFFESRFTQGVDYQLFLTNEENRKKSQVGRKRELIGMTISAFKAFALEARTGKAREIKAHVELNALFQSGEQELRLRRLVELVLPETGIKSVRNAETGYVRLMALFFHIDPSLLQVSSARELAKRLGVSEQTFKNRLYEVRDKLEGL